MTKSTSVGVTEGMTDSVMGSESDGVAEGMTDSVTSSVTDGVTGLHQYETALDLAALHLHLQYADILLSTQTLRCFWRLGAKIEGGEGNSIIVPGGRHTRTSPH